MNQLSKQLKRLFNPYRWNNQYLKLDSVEELESVRQSPPRATPLTLSEKILLVPQYMTAISIYLDLCFLYYTAITLKGVPLAIAFAYAFYCDKVSPFTIGCALFVGHFFASALSLKLFFSNKERVRWMYDLIGEDRVRHKVFQSQPVSRVWINGGKAIAIIVGAEVASHSTAAAITSWTDAYDTNRNEQLFIEQKKRHIVAKEELYTKPISPKELREELVRENKLMDNQTSEYHLTKKNIRNRLPTRNGMVREIMNVELKLETRKMYLKTLQEWIQGKK